MQEPYIEINGTILSPFHSDWHAASGEPELGDIHDVDIAKSLTVALHDYTNAVRVVDIWVYDKIPSEHARRIAEVTCSDDNFVDNMILEIQENEPCTTANSENSDELIKVYPWTRTETGIDFNIDFRPLLSKLKSRLYVIMPIIWYPNSSANAPNDWKTASWVYSVK